MVNLFLLFLKLRIICSYNRYIWLLLLINYSLNLTLFALWIFSRSHKGKDCLWRLTIQQLWYRLWREDAFMRLFSNNDGLCFNFLITSFRLLAMFICDIYWRQIRYMLFIFVLLFLFLDNHINNILRFLLWWEFIICYVCLFNNKYYNNLLLC